MAALTIQERLVIAGLMLEGKRYVVDGYKLTHPKAGLNATEDSVYKMASRWFNGEAAKAWRREIALRIGSPIDGQAEEMTDNEIMRELTKAARTEADSNKKSQILMRVADMRERIVATDPKQEDKHVILYLPFNCDCRQCELYLREKQKNETPWHYGEGEESKEWCAPNRWASYWFLWLLSETWHPPERRGREGAIRKVKKVGLG